MILKHIKAVVLGVIFIASSANATLITHDSRSIVANYNDEVTIDSWNSLTSNINTQSVPNFVNVQTGKNLFNYLTIDFTMAFDGVWELNAGLDAGYGAALYVDGREILKRSDDIWWSKNWSHSDVIVESFDLLAGNHKIELLWAEGCCNGVSTLRFSDSGNNDFSLLTVDNINTATAAVPEPTSIALLALSMFALALRRKA